MKAVSSVKSRTIDILPKININKSLLNETLLVSPCYSWNRIYRREFLRNNNIKFSTMRCFEDVIFILKSHILAQNVSYIDSPFYVYRLRKSSTLRAYDERYLDLFNTFAEIDEFLQKVNVKSEIEKNVSFFKVMNIFWTYRNVNNANRRRIWLLATKVLSLKEILILCGKLFSKNLKNIFSVVNKGKHKVITILGIKIKLRRLDEQDRKAKKYIKKLKRNQKKYPKDCYLLFDCLLENNVEGIDAYSLFCYMKSIGKNVYYAVLKNSALYEEMQKENKLDNIIAIPAITKSNLGSYV
jgi:hypothetical protein